MMCVFVVAVIFAREIKKKKKKKKKSLFVQNYNERVFRKKTKERFSFCKKKELEVGRIIHFATDPHITHRRLMIDDE